jgi:hypothetical protein
MITHLETDFDVTDTFSALGELAENPLHLHELPDDSEEDQALADWNEKLECGALDLDMECEGVRLA